jgi:hypothetical protein
MANKQFDSVRDRYGSLCDNALRLNNIGAKYLDHGNEKLAIETLSEAMHIFKHLIGVSAAAKKKAKASGWARNQCSNSPHTTTLKHQTVLLSHHWARQRQDWNQIAPALFDSAIMIDPVDVPINVEDREDFFITCTGVVIFNLALAYHSMGIGTTSGCQAQQNQVYPPASTASSQRSHSYYYYTTKAANIYEMVIKMLLGRSSCTAMLVQLASIRNILEIQLLTTTGDHGTDLSYGAKNKARNGRELFSKLLTSQQQQQQQQQQHHNHCQHHQQLVLLSDLLALQDPQLHDLVSTILLLLKPATIAAAA